MEVDVTQNKVLSRTDLDQPYTRITLNQGVIALACPETTVVMTYKTQ